MVEFKTITHDDIFTDSETSLPLPHLLGRGRDSVYAIFPESDGVTLCFTSVGEHTDAAEIEFIGSYPMAYAAAMMRANTLEAI